MTVLNKKMLYLFRELDWKDKKLDKKLYELVSDGFVLIDECVLLRSFYEHQRHVKRQDFQDDVAYECFINSFHVDDYIESDFMVQGFLLIDEVFKIWNKKELPSVLKAIISQTEFGANVKFHLMRANVNWIQETEVEKFDEPILISESIYGMSLE